MRDVTGKYYRSVHVRPRQRAYPGTTSRPEPHEEVDILRSVGGQLQKKVSRAMNHNSSCTFCAIAHAFPPSPPLTPPTPSPNDDPVIFPQAHIIISTNSVLAFLDIQPLTKGHVLVCPRYHVEKVTDMTPSESCRVGAWLPIIARAVVKVAGVTDFNIIQNNGIHAAQVVPHVHYHIIPRPSNEERELLVRKVGARWLISKYGDGVRTDLDDEEGGAAAKEIRDNVFKELEGMEWGIDGRIERKLLSSL